MDNEIPNDEAELEREEQDRLLYAADIGGLTLVVAALVFMVGTAITSWSYGLDQGLLDDLVWLTQGANIATAAVCGLGLVAVLASDELTARGRLVVVLVLVAAVTHVVAGSVGILDIVTADYDRGESFGSTDANEFGIKFGSSLVYVATILSGAAIGTVAMNARTSRRSSAAR